MIITSMTKCERCTHILIKALTILLFPEQQVSGPITALHQRPVRNRGFYLRAEPAERNRKFFMNLDAVEVIRKPNLS